MTRDSKWLYLGVIFLVGFTSLIYEIYSVRVLFMFFVENTQGATIAISSFLGGLAFSSLFFQGKPAPPRSSLVGRFP
jgi:hypothetical protein